MLHLLKQSVMNSEMVSSWRRFLRYVANKNDAMVKEIVNNLWERVEHL